MRAAHPHAIVHATLLAALAALATVAPGASLQTARPARLVRVVDGDTLVVERPPVRGISDGWTRETVRLLGVDTEERIGRRVPSSPSRPATVFGEETALWLADELAGVTELALRFPPGGEERDAFGRLLAHVVLPDGRDLTHELVLRGRSPYYVKYGRSRLDHAGLARAQAEARRERRGLWDPRTNRPRVPGRPQARPPYERLLAWWELRAEALEHFRRLARAPNVLAAWDPEALERALTTLGAGARVEVFGEVARLEETSEGDLEVVLRSRDRERALRWRAPSGGSCAAADGAANGAGTAPGCPDLGGRGECTDLAPRLERTRREFHQNYVTLRGALHRRGRAFLMVACRATDWSVGPPAGPASITPPPTPTPSPAPSSRPPRSEEDMSKQPTEIELKFAVEGEDAFDALVRHLDLPTREFHATLDQVNHFFDTPAFALHERKVTLRLREENRRHLLTLKGPEQSRSADGVATERVEVEVRLAPELALDVLQGTVSPREALAQRIGERAPGALTLLDEALAGAELHYAGRFETRRTRLSPVTIDVAGAPVQIVFELDRVVFGPERIDHEIEVEVTSDVDVESLSKELGALLDAAGIPWKPALSKAHRFFELARESR